jgi:probable F420-dependent oxidoreductase
MLFRFPEQPTGGIWECWTLLAALAEATERVDLGTIVLCVPFRNPAVLAKMDDTLEEISGGRLILGLGAGWHERDYAEYGYAFGTPGSRLDDLERALPRIEARWAALNPPPTRKIPMLIGGGGEKRTLRYAARHADIWHCNADVATLTRKGEVLDGWCRVEGRDPAGIERSTAVDQPTIDSTARPGPAQLGEPLLAAGFTLFNVRSSGPAYDLGPLRDWLAWRDDTNGEFTAR